MGSKRRYTDDQLSDAVKTSVSKSDILRKLGLRITGGNFNSITMHIARLGLSSDHLLGRKQSRPYRGGGCVPKSYDDILVKDSPYTSTYHLKNRLIKDGMLLNECSVCTISTWMDKELILHLDHINGNRRDCRRENLRLLCPNCHSQTPTYCGRNIGGSSRI